jgi:calnexin
VVTTQLLINLDRFHLQPADWDETAPATIVDESATIPEDWLVDEPKVIPDPEAEKPEEWDDEEDGDWVPDMVPNPTCEAVSGCGEWEAPTIRNPAYKASNSTCVIFHIVELIS